MITTNTELDATSTCLPISCRSLEDYDLQPGSGVFVGEYLFSGSEENSVDFVIEEVLLISTCFAWIPSSLCAASYLCT